MRYFTISEMLRSDTALKMGIWNGANLEHEENMRALVENVLDPLRARYGHPIYVSSGYRCPKLNNAVNGAINSQHMRGEAADIYAGLGGSIVSSQGTRDGGSQSAMRPSGGSASKGTIAPNDTTAPQNPHCGLDPQSPKPMNLVSENLKLAQMIAEAGNFDQMILEEVPENSLEPRWIHVSYKRLGWNRRNILKKVSGKAGYQTVSKEKLK